MTELQTKSFDQLIHISNFVLESHGCLKLPWGSASAPQEPTNATFVIYAGTKGNVWWNMKQLCAKIQKAIHIFECLHPEWQAVFVFDFSPAHKAHEPAALQVRKMNLNPGGEQGCLQDTTIPMGVPKSL